MATKLFKNLEKNDEVVIGEGGADANAVHYSADTGKSSAQKETARNNIGAASANHSHSYNDLSNKPKIANTELSGNKSLSDLGIMSAGVTHLSGDIATSERGVANGVATLGSDGKLESSQMPTVTVPTKTSDLTNDGPDGTHPFITGQAISGKADKVAGATSGNFAGLDANGNLTDSEYSPDSFDGAGIAESLVDEHNGSDNAHSALFEGKMDANPTGIILSGQFPDVEIQMDELNGGVTKTSYYKPSCIQYGITILNFPSNDRTDTIAVLGDLEEKLDSNQVADNWSSSATYAQGDNVTYKGKFYKSLLNNNINHEPDPESAMWWDVCSLFSGDNTSLVGVINARLPYPINTAGTILDRNINVMSGVAFSIPEGFKDLLIRFAVTDTAPSITFNGTDVDIDDYGDALPSSTDTGDYILTLTRIASDECYIRVVKLEERA